MSVVDCGSFSDAGRRLGVVPSTVSKYVATLEERLNCQLIVRSTKNLSVTESGEFFYQRCETILAEASSFESEMVRRHVHPRGTLRLMADAVFAQHHLTPVMIDFLAAYPSVKLELLVTTGPSDRKDIEFDVAIMMGMEPEAGMVARHLAPNIVTLCASPSYLDMAGTPAKVDDLKHHNCMFARDKGPQDWALGDSELASTIRGNIVVDNNDFLRVAALEGAGIARVPRFMIHDDIVAGNLVELFPERRTSDGSIFAAHVGRKPLSPIGQAFLDHIRDVFAQPPAWAA